MTRNGVLTNGAPTKQLLRFCFERTFDRRQRNRGVHDGDVGKPRPNQPNCRLVRDEHPLNVSIAADVDVAILEQNDRAISMRSGRKHVDHSGVLRGWFVILSCAEVHERGMSYRGWLVGLNEANPKRQLSVEQVDTGCDVVAD